MKKTVAMLLILVLMLTLIGCGSEKTEQEKIVKIGLLRIDDSIPFYVAQEEGLFEKYQVNVELLSFSSSSDQSVAMEAGELDMAMNDMIVQSLMKKNGTDTKIVQLSFGAVPAEGRFVVVANPNSRIKTPKDLEGKKVAISTNTMMDYLFEQFEQIYDLDATKIEKINMPNLMLRVEALLAGNDIDAAILPDPLASYAIYSGATIVIDDSALEENLSQSVILATDEVIHNYKPEITKVLQAYNEAQQMINDNPDKYREICLSTANVPQELQASYPTPSYTNYALPTEKNVERVQNWLESRGLLEKSYTYQDLVADFGFVK